MCGGKFTDLLIQVQHFVSGVKTFMHVRQYAKYPTNSNRKKKIKLRRMFIRKLKNAFIGFLFYRDNARDR